MEYRLLNINRTQIFYSAKTLKKNCATRLKLDEDRIKIV